MSAFSLAAGVVQVVDVSFRALSICREIYKNGSLVEHRDTTEITEHLKETTQHLENSFSNVPASAAKHSKDVIDISKKCSGVAAEVRCSGCQSFQCNESADITSSKAPRRTPQTAARSKRWLTPIR